MPIDALHEAKPFDRERDEGGVSDVLGCRWPPRREGSARPDERRGL